uniref:ATP synthase F0 subunit 8 n=1 Tax=Lispe assimilis TaxID=1670692 RepID=UPI001D0318D6|nr:ATP synthase F0 subunit 8 [Lispe assimilis]QVG62676.1 ATP synthase F0 subunit 8 [Lispe assimilis]
MPQMMPMNWIMLFIYFIMIFIMFNMMNFFFFMKKLTLPHKTDFIKHLFSWKW